MKKIATILAVAALAAVVVNPDTSGPYTDSHGNIYHILPQISDFPTVADFDAAIGHEIFTTRDGRKFQIDRPLTPSELATALANQVVNRALQPNPGSFNGIAAVVTINHPVDENARCHHLLRVNRTQRHNFACLNDGDFGRRVNLNGSLGWNHGNNQNFVKSRFWSFLAMPIPVSATVTLRPSLVFSA